MKARNLVLVGCLFLISMVSLFIVANLTFMTVFHVELEKSKFAEVELGAKYYVQDKRVIIRFVHLVLDRDYFCAISLTGFNASSELLVSESSYYFFHALLAHIETSLPVDFRVWSVSLKLYVLYQQDYLFLQEYYRGFLGV